MIDELRSAGKQEDVDALASNIKENLDKIVFHGKRADSIVKSMLLHSRTGSGKKEATDINQLVDEYLRLSFHGMRAKEKAFTANFETNYDPNAGTINILPQEIGRVLLNLFNNSFYSMMQKKTDGVKDYDPLLNVSTRRNQSKIEISVKDNGLGIPQSAIDKIFQPFFTTKPTGQGTGLGLSLSYDIIRTHGGELKVVTKEGEGAEFIISL